MHLEGNMKYKKSNTDRWQLSGGNSIIWDINNDVKLPHKDHLEMSGKLVSLIVSYGIDEHKSLVLSRNIIWPNLRTIPNNTHASLSKEYGSEIMPDIKIDNVSLSEEKPYCIKFDGLLTIKSSTEQQIDVTQIIFPSTEHSTAIERVELINTSSRKKNINVKAFESSIVERGSYGIYMLETFHDAPSAVELQPGESTSFNIFFNGRKLMDKLTKLNANEEEVKRREFIESTINSIKLETPNPIINQAFNFAKIRAAESIFSTPNGLMHCPGGGHYYAAVWTNDQAEYAGPFFPFLGYASGNDATLNCFRLYRPFMGPNYHPIPSSIIAGGIDIWEGAGDRGDAAMYAYGASRFLLEMGNKEIAEELWPAIQWCLEYCNRKITSEGVIASDSDELEGRFPAGNANLSTSSITYGALRSAANLARELGNSIIGNEYDLRADKLCESIETYFGANIEGYDTYRYYEGNDILRSWICIPLTMGIMKRREGTIAALFSPRLWTEDGLATEAGDNTFWDRSTLYGFRGAFAAGETEKALKYFIEYSRRRTLGNHVPYAVEAFPEGNQRHLSAESALYCRIITEGLFGITPIGFNSFTCSPHLPSEWSFMTFRSIKAFGRDFDLTVERIENKYKITVIINKNQVREYFCEMNSAVSIFL